MLTTLVFPFLYSFFRFFKFISLSEPEADAEVCAEGHGGPLHRRDECCHQLAQGIESLPIG
jgi:hypothetical protein